MEDNQRGKKSNRIDPESAELMSPETRKALLKMFEDAMIDPLAQLKDKDGNSIGKVLIFGTMSEDTHDLETFKDMFYNPLGYELINPEPQLNFQGNPVRYMTKEEIINEYGDILTPKEKEIFKS